MEVAGIVSNKDDFEMFCSTFRSYFIGILFTILITSVNQFYSYRTIQYTIPQYVLLLLAYPLGKFLAWCLPKKKFIIFNWNFSLNPGCFTIKEHAIIYIMIVIASRTITAIDIIVIKHVYLKMETKFIWGLLLAISSQTMGYGAA
ncbi:unnamed protein product, partial [Didymodactylos carnosus]